MVIITTNNANQMLGIIFRGKRKILFYKDKIVSYLRIKKYFVQYDRIYLEFVVPVWLPILKDKINLNEQVQHRVTKLIAEIKNLSYD